MLMVSNQVDNHKAPTAKADLDRTAVYPTNYRLPWLGRYFLGIMALLILVAIAFTAYAIWTGSFSN